MLAVPSVVVNYLLNPRHSGFGELVAGAKEVGFQPDTRLEIVPP